MLFWFYAKFGGFKDFVTTSTISHLTGEKLKTIPIPVPPIKLQNQFENKIHILYKMRESSSKMMGENLLQTLIQKAFKGELIS
jgi:type I restriction enzyme S subunit